MKIDDLIKNRKEQLNVESPPPEIWQAISKEIGKKEKPSFQWWKVAAIVFVCLSVGLLIQNRVLQSQVDKLASLGDISEEYSKIEVDYINRINVLEASLPIEEMKTNSEYIWLFEELKVLEEINRMYRSDIGIANEEELVGVLIDYYEKKLKLLGKLELEIKRNSKQKDNEKTPTNHIRI